jgi:hypothetical protein
MNLAGTAVFLTQVGSHSCMLMSASHVSPKETDALSLCLCCFSSAAASVLLVSYCWRRGLHPSTVWNCGLKHR